MFSPADIDQKIEEKATEIAIDVINKLEMVGILAVELFLTKDGSILVNEVAPRTHNSGHHTIECNVTSQFEQHMRAVLNMPLGSTELIRFGVMLNLIGSEGYSGDVVYEGMDTILMSPAVHPHIYGKATTKPNRKMGHITVSAASMQEAKRIAEKIKNSVRVIAS